MKTKIINGRILQDGAWTDGVVLYFEDGIITEISAQNKPCDEEIDAHGCYVSPGFIDLHTHGAGGADFMDGTVDAYMTASRMHASHGTTALYPTVLSGSREDIDASCALYAEACKEKTQYAKMLGLHLEGPYFAYAFRGAQDPKHLRNPDPTEYKELVRKYPGMIKRWSCAPELEGSEEFATFLKEHGILAAFGHTEADCRDAYRLYDAGFTHITHLYSCTTTVYRKDAKRYAGLVEAAYLHDGITFEIIGDGIHLPPELLQFVYKFKPTTHVALITDSMRAAGMEEGESILGGLKTGQRVIVEEGVAKLPDRTAFAGSVATMDRVVRNMVKMGGATLADAVKMASETPAAIMKLTDTGKLQVGYAADIIIFDEEIDVKRTIADGQTVYQKQGVIKNVWQGK
ncbi:MAG: N-acetylglucosamine-6-phosphate deacetylase [Clostridia bacterium]|nr:N-acetylglucosamine-6-phosphate deacetylase [Clostridia bacterium]